MTIKLKKIDDFRWLIPISGNMNTEGLIYCSEDMVSRIIADNSLLQVSNVAQLPGIVGRALAMPDIHWGYGFPIGGVAAFDLEQGVISPGGVGYDINCGVRLMTLALGREEVTCRLNELLNIIFKQVPCGLGSKRQDFKLTNKQLDQVLLKGARWAVKQGFGQKEDLQFIEEMGEMKEADPSLVSEKAKLRGLKQFGTLGSGNHFIEIGWVEEIYDKQAASDFGLAKDQVTITVHTGSRGLGYQVCDDFLHSMIREQAEGKGGTGPFPDRQLTYAYLNSKMGHHYFAAMNAAANYAFCNRQLITYWIQQSLEMSLGISPAQHRMRLVYDVCHNIAKKEEHLVKGRKQRVCVHRKGATRALPPGHPLLPAPYQKSGQPVLIPGDMGRCSFVLKGAEKALTNTFASSCHGAGRLLSRTAAKKSAKGRNIRRELEDSGIKVRIAGKHTLAEEMPEAYKDVNEVVDVMHGAGISFKVAKLRPLGVLKG